MRKRAGIRTKLLSSGARGDGSTRSRPRDPESAVMAAHKDDPPLEEDLTPADETAPGRRVKEVKRPCLIK